MAGAQLNPRPVVKAGRLQPQAKGAGGPSRSGRAVAAVGSSLLAAAHCSRQPPCAGAQHYEVGKTMGG